LRLYAEAAQAAVIVARAGGQIIGAATCLPLPAETANVQKPFHDAGWDISRVYYFGESVLEKSYRGRGIGVKFFAAREAEARAHGYPVTAFCAVQRPADHPARPKDYQPLDDFWRRRGYTPHPELVCTMSWREVGAQHETAKPLMFWTREL
jgi:GNAT superfamily N-acetyltransferase